jgi:hypothetical protein
VAVGEVRSNDGSQGFKDGLETRGEELPVEVEDDRNEQPLERLRWKGAGSAELNDNVCDTDLVRLPIATMERPSAVGRLREKRFARGCGSLGG